ncbi:N-formylglutamate amidohydrolase [Sphingomonas japonica]|uniref:N-formylglutamate amidohydrolase n=1 Tax=Sphingomonas japonica TaxID=511662 RepID=A0ABX0U3B2_9SPHN|nr:N-formylglutamate amidohydrolase [Sphingomonas japonica]NIJ25066.1 putative N-formylglutamate amidohydrolase [Sphingomonas japonica]
MIELPEILEGEDSSVLLIADHASNRVPPDIDLEIPCDLLAKHIAWDIGTERLTRLLAKRLAAPAVIAVVSRLVIDLHRDPAHVGLVPVASDGYPIPGNVASDIPPRIARFHVPHHAAIDAMRQRNRPVLIAALHSFTPSLESKPSLRPWEVGLLYNRDDRAARIAIEWLTERGHVVGDNQPYSGRLLNATQDRHAEAHDIPYLTIEVRNDLIANDDGVVWWAGILADMIDHVRNRVAPMAPPAT